MWHNYLITALRNLLKYRQFTLINIGGLAIGLAALIITRVIVNHETSYDRFFPDYQRIYAVYTVFKPDAGVGVNSVDGAWQGVRPFLQDFVPGLETSARSIAWNFAVRAGDKLFEQSVRFVDPEFLDIFALHYLHGDAHTALSSPTGLILTQSAARRYFGPADVLGKTLTLSGLSSGAAKSAFRVTAVIEDLPHNSHFVASLLPRNLSDPRFDFIAPMDAFRALTRHEPDDGWNNLSVDDLTYVRLRKGADLRAALAGLQQIFQQHVPKGADQATVAGFGLRPLTQLSQYIWNASGLPIPQSVRIIGVLILLIAIFNYTSLANVQASVRTVEIGLRKSLGARRSQLFVQFLGEAVVTSLIALGLALVLAATIVPIVGAALGQQMKFPGPETGVGFLFGVALATGLLAGLLPAWRISRTAPGACLAAPNGVVGGSRLRNVMIGMQFLVASVLAAVAILMYAQNAHMRTVARTSFAMDRIVVLDRPYRLGSQKRVQTLKREILALDGVEAVSETSQVPFEQGQNRERLGRVRGDTASSVQVLGFWGDYDFLKTFQIPILAGRDFSVTFAHDPTANGPARVGSATRDLILNEMAARRLGWNHPADAIGKTLYQLGKDEATPPRRIVGIAANVNFLGFHNRVSPSAYFLSNNAASHLSIRVATTAPASLTAAIEERWHAIAPDVPIARSLLRSYFEQWYALFSGMDSWVIAPLAAVAILLAVVGLYGLAAFSARQRTREIGIRKVLGARSSVIVRLLIWQMSRPVLLSLLLAVPLAWLAGHLYLDFFSDRVAFSSLYLIASTGAVLAVAWLAIAEHALRVARMHPALALREE